MILPIVFLCIALLILLIAVLKVNAFLSFLIVSAVAGLSLGLPLNKIAGAMEKGMGDVLGGLVIIITAGAMLGKLVAESGAAQKIAQVLMKTFGEKHLQWAMVLSGFIIGIPLFYGIGFVLMVPLIFSVVYRYKLNAIYIGLPMLAALSVTHGFLPPHPSPSALVVQFHANMGLTLCYGMLVAIPAILIGGPLLARTLTGIQAKPLETFVVKEMPEDQLPGTFISLFMALLPVFLLALASLLPFVLPVGSSWLPTLAFIGSPSIVMLLVLVVATFTLGVARGRSMTEISLIYGNAVKDIAMILLIIAGSGALKEILIQTGVSQQLAGYLQGLSVEPLILGWLITAFIRFCVGSATVAGLTTAGIIYPLMIATGTNPNLMVLVVGAGSLMFSHVNDSGFWMFKEYFNLSLKDTFRSWALMETVVGVVGLIGVLILNMFI
jgi:Gnt-I system high-affinity gluconate transporter